MTLRPMTLGRWVEFLALLPATLVVMPLVGIYLFWAPIRLLASGLSDLTAAVSMVGLLLAGVWSVGSMVAVWCLVLFGLEEIAHRLPLRLFAVTSPIVGLALALIMTPPMVRLSRPLVLTDFMGLMLLGPVLVGLRYLPRLIRPRRN